MTKRITIKDIANHANMSLATVSGVLNGETRFSDKTRKHVWDIANRLNYSPSESARGLRASRSEERRKTGVIMHIVHMLDVVPRHARDQEADVYRLAWQAQQRGQFVIPYCYYQQDGFQCPPLLNGLVDGAIIGTPHLEVVNTVKAKVPVVLMDVPFSTQLVDVPMVNIDYRYGFLVALEKLKSLGHQSIVMITPLGGNGSSDIYDAHVSHSFREAAMLSGIEVLSEYGDVSGITSETHEARMLELARQLVPEIHNGKITAITAVNICYVTTLMKYLLQMGIRIPEDVSLTAPYLWFDPIPGISNIFSNREKLIDASLDLLKTLIDGQPIHCYENLVRPKLIPAATIGKAKHNKGV